MAKVETMSIEDETLIKDVLFSAFQFQFHSGSIKTIVS